MLSRKRDNTWVVRGGRMLESLIPGPKYTLQKFSEVDALKSVLTTYFPGHLLELGPRSREFRAVIGLCSLDKMSLFRGSYKGALRLSIPDSAYFAHGFPVQGQAETVSNRVVTTSSPDRGAVAEPGELIHSTSPDFESVVMLINPETLSETVGALIGRSGLGPLKLEPPNTGSRPEARLLRGLVTMLFNELDGVDRIPAPVVAELQQAILVAFVSGYDHNFSHLLDRPPPQPAPWQTRRVEEYIMANWDQPISIEALAIVANASARSVFNAFRVHRGYTPMNFLKKLRLEHSREMLSHPEPQTTVTAAAFSCGFGNLGHFASDYHKAFGETPSESLRRAKRNRRL